MRADSGESGASDMAMTTLSSSDTTKAAGYLKQWAVSRIWWNIFTVLLPTVTSTGHVPEDVFPSGMLMRSSAQDRSPFSRYLRYCSLEGRSCEGVGPNRSSPNFPLKVPSFSPVGDRIVYSSPPLSAIQPSVVAITPS